MDELRPTRVSHGHGAGWIWLLAGIALPSWGCGQPSSSCGDRACAESSRPEASVIGSVTLPELADWTDLGLVIDTGRFGAWDTIMEGITPSAVVRRDGMYLLYYIGSDDYIADPRNIGPARRAIGVAMSADGIRWEKAPVNPVITYSSSGNPEEGAVSLGVIAEEGRPLLAYYGANVASTPTTALVNADVRLATSPDGVSFTTAGKVIEHRQASVWGHGDEIHPTLALRRGGTYYVYYVPNGTKEAGRLGVCQGSTPTSLTTCGPVKSGRRPVRSRGPSSAVPIDRDTLAFFVNDRDTVDVYIVDTTDLTAFGTPAKRYPLSESTVFALDRNRRTWFAYYNKWTHIGLRIAPAGPPDATPPSAPLGLTGSSPRHDRVTLTWSHAFDPDTGILRFDIYRDGRRIGSTRGHSFTDSGLVERTSYDYEVRAVNLHGVQGSGAAHSVRTAQDNVPPAIEAVSAVTPDQVVITFSEPISNTSGSSRSSYTIGDGVRVQAATVAGDPRVVTLTTSPMTADAVYTLAVAKISDRAAQPNQGWGQSRFTAYALPGVIGHWRMDDADTAGTDSSGAGHAAAVFGVPVALSGRVLGGIGLGGRDYLELPPYSRLDTAAFGSFSVSAWARPADAPAGTTTTNAAYTIFSGPGGLELKYGFDKRFVAALGTSTGQPSLASGTFAPGLWHHLAMVVDANQNTFALFVDGNPVSGSPRTLSADRVRPRLASPNHEQYHNRYRIGVTNPLFSDNSNYFIGALDEVRLYSRALSQAELRGLLEPTSHGLSSREARAADAPYKR